MDSERNETDIFIDRVYDIAVAPERLEQLIDSWTAQLQDGCVGQRLQVLSEPGVLDHVKRAERVLRELIALDAQDRDSARDWTQTARTAAIVVNRAGVVVAANVAAQQTLALVVGTTLSVIPIEPGDRALLVDLIDNLGRATDSGIRLLRLRTFGENAPMLVRIVEAIGGDNNQIGLVTSLLAWPVQLTVRLMSTFQLTPAEGDVLQQLTLGFSVKEVCERTQRSEPTIRSHVRALLEKTRTRSQVELVRVTLGLLDVAEPPSSIAPMRGPPGVVPEANDYKTLKLRDGRKLDYLVIGDPRGAPFLMLPTDIGFTRLPPPAESWLTSQGMRMIVPVRAGYGRSSPIPRHRDAFDVAIADMIALSNTLGIARCPVLAFCDDFHLAVAMACAAPDRISTIVAVGPTLPATEAKHFQRMPKWTRFIVANARHAPGALPYVAMALFQCLRRLGPRRFMQTIMATSKSDLRVIADDEILTALLRGTEISVGPRFTAHVAWAAGAVSNYAVDWSDKLKACPVPMVLFAGQEDPFAPIETTREFAALTPGVTLHEVPAYGQLLYPLWPRFIGEVQRQLGR